MPASDYDLAGFAVGAVERGEILPRADMVAGDVLIGLPSSGVHSNGYSLVRRLVSRGEAGLGRAGAVRRSQRALARGAAGADAHLREAGACRPMRATGGVKALAHITGGGLSENLPRVLPDGIAAHVDLARLDGAGRVRLAAAGRPTSTTRRCCAPSTAASA